MGAGEYGEGDKFIGVTVAYAAGHREKVSPLQLKEIEVSHRIHVVMNLLFG